MTSPRAPPGARADFVAGTPDLSLFPRAAWAAAHRGVLAGTAAPGARLPRSARAAPAARPPWPSCSPAAGAWSRIRSGSWSSPGWRRRRRCSDSCCTRAGRRRVGVEDPGQPASTTRCSPRPGVGTVPLPLDDEGLAIGPLHASGVRAVVTTPAHQFPTGIAYSARRRAELLDWARSVDGCVVEDDYDGDFRYDRAPVGALQGLDPERVAYTGSVSKSLAPGLRLGWLLVPAALADEVVERKRTMDLGHPALDQALLARFVERGDYDRQLRRCQRAYRERRDALVAALDEHFPGTEVSGIAAGLHVIAALPRPVRAPGAVPGAGRRRPGSTVRPLTDYAHARAEPDETGRTAGPRVRAPAADADPGRRTPDGRGARPRLEPRAAACSHAGSGRVLVSPRPVVHLWFACALRCPSSCWHRTPAGSRPWRRIHVTPSAPVPRPPQRAARFPGRVGRPDPARRVRRRTGLRPVRAARGGLGRADGRRDRRLRPGVGALRPSGPDDRGDLGDRVVPRRPHDGTARCSAPDTDFTGTTRLRGLPSGEQIHYRVLLADPDDPRRTGEPVPAPSARRPAERRDGVRFLWSGDLAGQGWGINPDLGGYRDLRGDAPARPGLLPVQRRQHLRRRPDRGDRRRCPTAASGGTSPPRRSPRSPRPWPSSAATSATTCSTTTSARFNAQVPSVVQWDDHEVRNNWYPGRDPATTPATPRRDVDVLAARARRAFSEYFPVSTLRPGARDGRVYRVVRHGPLLDVFVLDMRTYRNANSPGRPDRRTRRASSAREQLDWLKRELSRSRAVWKVIAADMPLGLVVPDARRQANIEAVAQGDPGAPLGRELQIAELLRYIKHRRITGTVWLTADVHYTSAQHYAARRGPRSRTSSRSGSSSPVR